MGVQRFGYAPCPLETAAFAYKDSSSIPGTFCDAGAAVALVVAVACSVLLFALACLVLFLHMRRHFQRKRRGSRYIGI
jgi:hypothetical protein